MFEELKFEELLAPLNNRLEGYLDCRWPEYAFLTRPAHMHLMTII